MTNHIRKDDEAKDSRHLFLSFNKHIILLQKIGVNLFNFQVLLKRDDILHYKPF